VRPARPGIKFVPNVPNILSTRSRNCGKLIVAFPGRRYGTYFRNKLKRDWERAETSDWLGPWLQDKDGGRHMKSDEDAGHPDQHAVNDWFLYGPKNAEIENLVRELTLKRGYLRCNLI